MSLSVVGTTKEGIPIVLMKEGSTQTKGRDALRNNIKAATLVANMLKSVLGPRGMEKMLVDSLGKVTITNDGATILKEMDVQHPAAKMMVEVAKAVDNRVGDGTTSSVIIAGALLQKAGDLIDTIVQIRSAQSTSKNPWVGVDVKLMKVANMWGQEHHRTARRQGAGPLVGHRGKRHDTEDRQHPCGRQDEARRRLAKLNLA